MSNCGRRSSSYVWTFCYKIVQSVRYTHDLKAGSGHEHNSENSENAEKEKREQQLPKFD